MWNPLQPFVCFDRFAEYNATFEEQLERFESVISRGERLSRPYETGMRMGGEDFRYWAEKNRGDMMLWLDEGEVSILGHRSSRTHRIADVALHVLRSGIREGERCLVKTGVWLICPTLVLEGLGSFSV